LELRRFKTKLLLELVSRPKPALLLAGSHAWIHRMEEAVKKAAEQNPELAQKYEAYQARVREYLADA
jgi:hypothetical protein